jgi:hypothetical protein
MSSTRERLVNMMDRNRNRIQLVLQSNMDPVKKGEVIRLYSGINENLMEDIKELGDENE